MKGTGSLCAERLSWWRPLSAAACSRCADRVRPRMVFKRPADPLGNGHIDADDGVILVDITMRFPPGASFHTFTSALLGPAASVIIG